MISSILKTDRNINNLFKLNLQETGVCIVKGLFSEVYINHINTILDRMNPTVEIPYFKKPWGYGNLNKNDEFNSFYINLDNYFINNFFSSDYKFNHLVVNEKPAYVGIDVEWHQEIFNINTFAPG